MTAYAVLADVYSYGISAVACGNVSPADQQKMLDARNVWADGKLRGRYKLPLLSWDVDLTMNVAQLTAYDIMCRRGYNPAAPGDVNIRLRYQDAVDWFDGVQRQRIHPNVTETPAASPGQQAPIVITSERRGW